MFEMSWGGVAEMHGTPHKGMAGLLLEVSGLVAPSIGIAPLPHQSAMGWLLKSSAQAGT